MAEYHCITRGQRNVHLAAEAVAVGVVAPTLIYFATRPRLKRSHKTALGVATIAVDGWLL